MNIKSIFTTAVVLALGMSATMKAQTNDSSFPKSDDTEVFLDSTHAMGYNGDEEYLAERIIWKRNSNGLADEKMIYSRFNSSEKLKLTKKEASTYYSDHTLKSVKTTDYLPDGSWSCIDHSLKYHANGMVEETRDIGTDSETSGPLFDKTTKFNDAGSQIYAENIEHNLNRFKTTSSYVQDTLMEQTETSFFNNTTGEWNNHIKEVYTYENEWSLKFGRASHAEYFEWDTEKGEWFKKIIVDRNFSEQGVTQKIRKIYDMQTNALKKREKEETVYGENSYTFSLFFAGEEENSWIEGMRDEQTFDAENNLTTDIHYIYDYTANVLYPQKKSEIQADEDGRVINIKEYLNMNVSTPEFYLQKIHDSEYNDNGLKIRETTSSVVDGETKVISEFTWEYNASNQLTRYREEFDGEQETLKVWDFDENGNEIFHETITGKGTLEFKTKHDDYIYYEDYVNEDMSFIEQEIFPFTGAPENHIIKGLTIYNASESDYAPSRRMIFYLNAYNSSTGIEDVADAFEMSISPNPASQYIKVSMEDHNEVVDFCLYDLNGNVIMTQEINGTAVVAVYGIAPGLYVAQLRSNAKVVNKKVLIQRN